MRVIGPPLPFGHLRFSKTYKYNRLQCNFRCSGRATGSRCNILPMGLLDIFRRKPDPLAGAISGMIRAIEDLGAAQVAQDRKIVAAFEKSGREPTKEDWLRIGQLEADVKSLTAQWADYKDTFTRLILRFEKRDERAAKKAEDEPQLEIVSEVEVDPDPITTQVLARRRRHEAFKPGAGKTEPTPNTGG